MPAGPHDQDKALVERCIAGEPEAWEDLISLLTPVLRQGLSAIASRRGFRLPPEDMDDLLSKVWEDLLRDDKRLLRIHRPEASLERWILAIAVDRLLPRVRSQIREERRLEALRRASPLPAYPAEDLPDNLADRREQGSRLREAARNLPARERFAVGVFYWSGWSHRQIARALAIPVHQVGPLLQTARKQLRKLLDPPRKFSK